MLLILDTWANNENVLIDLLRSAGGLGRLVIAWDDLALDRRHLTSGAAAAFVADQLILAVEPSESVGTVRVGRPFQSYSFCVQSQPRI